MKTGSILLFSNNDVVAFYPSKPFKSVKVFYLIFHPPEVVSRYRDPQRQVGENYSYLFNLTPDKV